MCVDVLLFFQAEDGIRDFHVTGVQTCALPISAPGVRTVGRGDLDAVREMASIFSRVDQRRGGGHARSAVVQYLNADVSDYLRGTYADEPYAAPCSRPQANWPTCPAGWHSTTQNTPPRDATST